MSSGYLLDTNVLSEPGKRAPDPNVVAWLDSLDAGSTYLSTLTIGEVAQGAARLGARGEPYVRWLHDVMIPNYEGRILSIDARVALAWGELRGDSVRRGRTLPVIDSLLAATAIAHDLTLVTLNVRDFDGLPVDLVDPSRSP
ncbi:MAG: type II toxin-antitoxin system VapC family toxin [Trueperaceae bacterium]|nr:type II toxin-antitoxin system VapC family toxin [Trueperaceae bacterium]